jgi:hypothetical protein
MKPLNAKGQRLLVTLLRYVEQHGNVTMDIGVTYDGNVSVQDDLADALRALTEKPADRPAAPPAT